MAKDVDEVGVHDGELLPVVWASGVGLDCFWRRDFILGVDAGVRMTRLYCVRGLIRSSELPTRHFGATVHGLPNLNLSRLAKPRQV